MKLAEFVALLCANANKTKNLRTYSGKWCSGAARVPDNISTQIGHVVALLQAKIDQICNAEKEGLLLYNFQPILYNHTGFYCSLDMLVRPLGDIDNTSLKHGIPVQVVINGHTKQVCNSTQGLLNSGVISPSELEDENMENPIVYGIYSDYQAISGFIAISCPEPLACDSLFIGKLDRHHLIWNCVAYDSFTEAKQALVSDEFPYQYIGELVHPKEMLQKILQVGIGHHIIKVMDLKKNSIVFNTDTQTLVKESNPETEVSLYNEAAMEVSICCLQQMEDN